MKSKDSEIIEKGQFVSVELNSRCRRLGDLALSVGNIKLAQYCAKLSGDLSGLLLLYSASSDRDGMKTLGDEARLAGRTNVAFVAYFVTGQVEKCVELLVETGRIPEACLMARTYIPSMIPNVLELWKKDLATINERASDALADPTKYPNLFPDLEWALKVEDIFKSGRDQFIPASDYLRVREELDLNIVEIVKQQYQQALEDEQNQQYDQAQDEEQHDIDGDEGVTDHHTVAAVEEHSSTSISTSSEIADATSEVVAEETAQITNDNNNSSDNNSSDNISSDNNISDDIAPNEQSKTESAGDQDDISAEENW
jgi:coatomer subunit beta'